MTTIGRSPGDLRLFSSRRPDGALEAPPRRSSPYGRNRVRSTSPQARVHRSRGARPTELSLASRETDGGTTEIPRERWPPGAQLTQKPFAARQRANKERSREDPGQHRQEYRRHRRPQRTDRRGTRERLREARGPPMSPLLSLGLPTTRAAELRARRHQHCARTRNQRADDVLAPPIRIDLRLDRCQDRGGQPKVEWPWCLRRGQPPDPGYELASAETRHFAASSRP